MQKMANVPIILLAAGRSSRMGQPKQLLPWGNQTLIEHQIQTFLKTGSTLIVVLGANEDLIVPVIEKTDALIVINRHWKTGMGSSVSAGIKALAEFFPLADGALITLVDQPLITVEHLQNIIDQFHPGRKQIIVSQSSTGWKGVPALFDRYYFEELKKLKGDEGAKKVIQTSEHAVKCIECGDLLEDIDTADNYQRLLQKSVSRS